ncbi:hypothetical protein JCM19296_771 [Nonlabens ulvanivorans]|uniref:Uncharacterized protein n=1 Tax=Nonlabens ulvanivorans TaxID=906888 RepID=A0A081D8E7_NONUL|nr:hypothetical protein [Nonlabens ulvanivorans]GAK75193.1 hypothetical protein JCM19296_771 [Nonlabens ulvanivorans]
MKNNLLFFLAVIGFAFAKAQVTTNPSTPTQTDQVTLIFDSTGTALENTTGTLYAYTGVTINGNRWQNIIVPHLMIIMARSICKYRWKHLPINTWI